MGADAAFLCEESRGGPKEHRRARSMSSALLERPWSRAVFEGVAKKYFALKRCLHCIRPPSQTSRPVGKGDASLFCTRNQSDGPDTVPADEHGGASLATFSGNGNQHFAYSLAEQLGGNQPSSTADRGRTKSRYSSPKSNDHRHIDDDPGDSPRARPSLGSGHMAPPSGILRSPEVHNFRPDRRWELYRAVPRRFFILAKITNTKIDDAEKNLNQNQQARL